MLLLLNHENTRTRVYGRDVSRLFIVPTEVIVDKHVTVENGIINGATPVSVLRNNYA